MLYFEDMVPGEIIVGPTFRVDEDEMLAFARRWDPLPIHVDEAVAHAAHGAFTAPGIYILAIKQHLIHQLEDKHAVIASLGYDEVRFHLPVKAGDTVGLSVEWISRRRSKSRHDRGIVTIRISLANQCGEVVMSHLDTVLVWLRDPGYDISG